jgi:hypothetical protein
MKDIRQTFLSICYYTAAYHRKNRDGWRKNEIKKIPYA